MRKWWLLTLFHCCLWDGCEATFLQNPLLIPPSARWYCCCDGFRLESDEGGGAASVRLADGAGENGASIGHRSPEVGLRPQAEHSWTLHGHSEFTLPLLICYTKAVAACLQGRAHAAGSWGRNSSALWGCGGCCQDWTQRLGLRDVCHRASKAAEFVILHIWHWEFLVPSCQFALIGISIKKSWI